MKNISTDKFVLVDDKGNYLLVGFSKKEQDDAIADPKGFKLWLDVYAIDGEDVT